MAKIKLTLPRFELPANGKHVTFQAPCDCSDVECIQIDGVDYTVVDSLGNVVTGDPAGGTWNSGATVSVILNVDDRKAYILNGSTSLMMVGTTDPTSETVATLGKQYWNSAKQTLWSCTRRLRWRLYLDTNRNRYLSSWRCSNEHQKRFGGQLASV